MDHEAIARYILDTFDGLDVVAASDDVFFYTDPDGTSDPSRRLPFATIVTSDAYDQFSDLNRPSVYRLNVGLSRDTFRTLFPAPSASEEDDRAARFDFTALDRVMPHPVYGKMFWICVLNPSESTFAELRPLLGEAYDLALARHLRSRDRPSQTGSKT